MKKFFFILQILAMSVCFLGCDEQVLENVNTPDNTTSIRAEEVFELTAALSEEPFSIDPSKNISSEGGTYIYHLFEGLMKLAPVDDNDINVIIVNGQAEEFTLSEDGLKYTFKLRDDIFWSDGEMVEAENFVYSWQRLVDPTMASPYAYVLNVVENAKDIVSGEKFPNELGIKALDKKTLEITLAYPCPYFLEICASFATVPLRQDIVEAHPDNWALDPSTCVSNGPYRLTENLPGSHMLCQKQNDYYDVGMIGPEKLHFDISGDGKSAFSKFNTGEFGITAIFPPGDLPRLVEIGQVKPIPALSLDFIVINPERDGLSETNVRQAINLSIDRNYLVLFATQSAEIPATGMIPPSISDSVSLGPDFRTMGGEYYSVYMDDYSDNCSKARELLFQAGFSQGVGLPSLEFIYLDSPLNSSIAEALAYMWKTELKLDIIVTPLDWETYYQAYRTGSYDLALYRRNADYFDPMAFVSSVSIVTTAGVPNAAGQHDLRASLETAVNKANLEMDVTKRMEHLHQAESIIMEQSMAAPLYYNTAVYAMQEGLNGLLHTPSGCFLLMYCHEK